MTFEDIGTRHLHQNLNDLALYHGTDKASNGHNYCGHYEQYLRDLRHTPLTLLELGVGTGVSLRMWRDYFPKATIVGLDRRFTGECNCYTVVGDQADRVTIDYLAKHWAPFDVIIDDCSHLSTKTIRSFELLWPHLAVGGLYVVEDLHSSYHDWFYGTTEANANPDEPPEVKFTPSGAAQHTVTAMQFLKRLADEVQHPSFDDEYWRGHSVHSVQFFHDICFIRKGE